MRIEFPIRSFRSKSMTPIQDDFAVLSARLRSNTCIDLYDKNYLFRIKWIFPLVLLIAFISLSVLFVFELMHQSQLIFSSLLAMVVLVIVQVMTRKARVAAIKGDTLILRGIRVKSTITSLQSVKKASSFHFLGVHVTRLYYTLDNQKKSSFIFGGPSGMKTSLDLLIQHAKKREKK